MKCELEQQIKNLKDKSKLFELIVKNPQDSKELTSWTEIIQRIKFFKDYNEYHYGNFQQYFMESKDFKDLLDMGVDINYVDRFGNNFILYYYLNKNNTIRTNQTLYFMGEGLEYLFKNTNNIYLRDNTEHDLLFYFLNAGNGGGTGKNFFKLLKDYPDFDIHYVDKFNKNIFFHALIYNSPIQIFDYLFEKNVRTDLIDYQGYNLMLSMIFMPYNDDTKKIYDNLIKNQNILHKNDRGDCYLEQLLKMSINKENNYTHLYWLNYTCQKLISEDIKFSIEEITTIHKLFQKHATDIIRYINNEIQVNELKNDMISNITEAGPFIFNRYLESKCTDNDKAPPKKLKI